MIVSRRVSSWRSSVGALVGPVVHVLLLVAPLCGLGLLREALGDPSVGLLPGPGGRLFAGRPADSVPRSGRFCRARRPPPTGARGAGVGSPGLLLLAGFWTALLEHVLAGPGMPGWPQAWGVVLMSAGVALRAAAVLSLGRAFITEWRNAAGQPLVDRHIYGWLRHPSEAGNLSVFLGACLLLESRLALVLLVLLGPTTLAPDSP